MTLREFRLPFRVCACTKRLLSGLLLLLLLVGPTIFSYPYLQHCFVLLLPHAPSS